MQLGRSSVGLGDHARLSVRAAARARSRECGASSLTDTAEGCGITCRGEIGGRRRLVRTRATGCVGLGTTAREGRGEADGPNVGSLTRLLARRMVNSANPGLDRDYYTASVMARPPSDPILFWSGFWPFHQLMDPAESAKIEISRRYLRGTRHGANEFTLARDRPHRAVVPLGGVGKTLKVEGLALPGK
jgi:hypothetical protein